MAHAAPGGHEEELLLCHLTHRPERSTQTQTRIKPASWFRRKISSNPEKQKRMLTREKPRRQPCDPEANCGRECAGRGDSLALAVQQQVYDERLPGLLLAQSVQGGGRESKAQGHDFQRLAAYLLVLCVRLIPSVRL